jgi:hypothetical protein
MMLLLMLLLMLPAKNVRGGGVGRAYLSTQTLLARGAKKTTTLMMMTSNNRGPGVVRAAAVNVVAVVVGLLLLGGGTVAGLDVSVKVEDVPLVKEQTGLGVALVFENVTETEFKSRVVGGAAESDKINGTVGCGAGLWLDGRGMCALCPAGYYCPGNTSSSGGGCGGRWAVAVACPGGTANALMGGVSALEACVPCAAGTYTAASTTANEACRVCAAGTYCDRGANQSGTACPAHTTSSAGSVSLGECACLPGFLCTYTRTVRMRLRFNNVSSSSSSSSGATALLLAALAAASAAQGTTTTTPPPTTIPTIMTEFVQALQTALLDGLAVVDGGGVPPSSYDGDSSGIAAVFEGFAMS